MVDYTVVNGTGAQLSNINAGGTDVSPYSYRDGVTLTNTELAALLTTDGVAAIKDQTGVTYAAQTKRAIGIGTKYPNTAA